MTRCSEVFKAFRTCSFPKPSNGGVEGGIFWKYPKRVRFKYKPDPLEILTKSDWCYIVDLDMNFTGTAGSFTSGPGGSPMMAIMSVTLQEQYPLDIQKIDDLDLR